MSRNTKTPSDYEGVKVMLDAYEFGTE